MEFKNGKAIIYADIIASTFYMLSRYEEIIKSNCRDTNGRFLGKDSIVFMHGLGRRPLVDEWGRFLRDIARKMKLNIDDEQQGISKIYLTHDIDMPFKVYNLYSLLTQYIKNIINHGVKVNHPLRLYLGDGSNDPYNTFSKILSIDNEFSKKNLQCETLYFVISKGKKLSIKYCDIFSKKYLKLIKTLNNNNAKFGIHLSCEAAKNSRIIKKEINRFNKLLRVIKCDYNNNKILSRNHCLMWNDPDSVDDMEEFGITDDFTLGYADIIGFRCGTCKPYRFINPKTMRITNVVIHPLLIMECTLDRKQYMNLNYNEAFTKCCEIIDGVYKFNGEINILWHNSSFVDSQYQEKLYINLLNYIEKIKLGE